MTPAVETPSPAPAAPTVEDVRALNARLEAGELAGVEERCRAWLPQVDGALHARLNLQLAQCLNAQGRALEALRAARAGLEETQAGQDPRLHAEALLILGTVLQSLEAHAEAFEALHEAEHLLIEDDVLKARVLRRIGIGCSVVGRHSQAAELLERAQAMVPPDAPPADPWHARFSVLNARGRALDQRMQKGDDCRADYARLRDAWVDFVHQVAPLNLGRLEQMGIGNAGIASQRAGDIDAALHWLGIACERHRQRGMRSHLAVAQNHVGDCLFRIGRVDEAIAILEESLGLLQEGSPRELLETWEALAPIYEAAGRTADALAAYKTLRRMEKELADDDARQQADRLRQEAEVAVLIADWMRKADQDPLTGLANRRAHDRTLAHWLAREPVLRGGGLILADLDHFKDVNDRFGHQVGDAVLQRVAQVMQQFVRRDDLAVRLGGEELGLLIKDASEYSLAEIGERLRHAIETTAWEEIAPGLALTLSIGTAAFNEVEGQPDRASALYALADRRLYAAKHGGRNRVVALDP